MRLSVCLVNWNTREDLRACLNSLVTYPYTGGETEVIVVDNASADGSAAMVQAEFPGAHLIANAENRNYAAGTNQALAAATGDCLLLLNPDVEFTPGSLDALVGSLSAESRGAVAAKLVYPDGRTQPSVRGFPEPLPLLYDIFGLSRIFPRSPRFATYRQTFFDYESDGPAPQPMASCFLISRAALERVGNMDERFPLYFNDVDWCKRCWDSGLGIWYTARAVVIHKHGGTTRKVRKAAIWESHRALLRFYEKHYRIGTPVLLYGLLTALITLGAWLRTGRWGNNLDETAAKPRLRVCIVSWNAKEYLRTCLRDLRMAVANPATIETVVVDNDSSDGSPEMVEAEFPEVRLIHAGSNLGFSGGNNLAYADLTTDYALLLNSDAFCAPGSLDRLITFADAHPDAGIIGPKVLNTDGSIQFSCRRFPTFAAGVFRNVYLGRLFPRNKPAADYLMQDFDHASVRDVDWVSGCALLIRRDCLEKIGPLDDRTFFMYCEDMDWCLRAWRGGWRVVYYPDSVITHVIGRSSDKAADRMILEHSRSMWKFYKKHREFFRDKVPAYLRPLVPLGIYLRAYVRIGRRRFINPILNLFRGKTVGERA